MSTPTESVELELTFLARDIPGEIADTAARRIVDIYIPADLRVHARLRVRQNGSEYQLTKKLPVDDGDASIHTEATIDLDESEFAALEKLSSRRVVKDRYVCSIDGNTAEVDVFREQLQGLVLLDFEFASEAEKAAFTPPDVCLADVTQEDFIAGGVLAGRKYSDLSEKLHSFGYSSIKDVSNAS